MIINIDLTSNDFILCCIILSCICIHVMYLSTIADSHILFMILYYVALLFCQLVCTTALTPKELLVKCICVA